MEKGKDVYCVLKRKNPMRYLQKLHIVNHVGDSVFTNQSERIKMGRPKGALSKPRSDIGAKRGKYNTRYEKRGKTGKENNPIKSFWSHHTMVTLS